MWYLFQTITTIGFGDVIARSGYCENEDYEGQDLDNITNAVYWVSIELLESQSCIIGAVEWIFTFQVYF